MSVLRRMFIEQYAMDIDQRDFEKEFKRVLEVYKHKVKIYKAIDERSKIVEYMDKIRYANYNKEFIQNMFYLKPEEGLRNIIDELCGEMTEDTYIRVKKACFTNEYFGALNYFSRQYNACDKLYELTGKKRAILTRDLWSDILDFATNSEDLIKSEFIHSCEGDLMQHFIMDLFTRVN